MPAAVLSMIQVVADDTFVPAAEMCPADDFVPAAEMCADDDFVPAAEMCPADDFVAAAEMCPTDDFVPAAVLSKMWAADADNEPAAVHSAMFAEDDFVPAALLSKISPTYLPAAVLSYMTGIHNLVSAAELTQLIGADFLPAAALGTAAFVPAAAVLQKMAAADNSAPDAVLYPLCHGFVPDDGLQQLGQLCSRCPPSHFVYLHCEAADLPLLQVSGRGIYFTKYC